MQRFGFGLLLRESPRDQKLWALCAFVRGKKWNPSSEDIEDHENYGYYLKRWRRRKLRDAVRKEGSSGGVDEPLRLDRPRYQSHNNMDLYHMCDDYEENVHSDGGWDEPTRRKPKARSGSPKKKPHRRPGMSHSNDWTFGLRKSAEDEWDWDDLRTMYGLGPDEEEGDVDTAFASFASKMRKQRYEDDAYPPHPPLSPECTVHLRVLGLPVGVLITPKDLKNAFYKCALQWHPDRHDKDQKAHAESKFKQVQEAYKALQSHIQ